MKFQKLNDTDYLVMIPFSFSSEEEILAIIKNIFLRYQKNLNLKGFYQVVVLNRSFALFLQIIQKNDSYYKNSFDYRVVFDDESTFYFQTKDYFLVENSDFIYYFDEYYYALVDDSFDEILEKVEFGNFVLGSSIDLGRCDLIFHK